MLNRIGEKVAFYKGNVDKVACNSIVDVVLYFVLNCS